jgi:hypothetical protein
VWSGDGWCYIPELKIRQKFLVTNERDMFEFVSESLKGVIPKPEHYELLMYYPVSQSPLAWEESGVWGCDKYEQTTPSTQMSDHPPPSQSPLSLQAPTS